MEVGRLTRRDHPGDYVSPTTERKKQVNLMTEGRETFYHGSFEPDSGLGFQVRLEAPNFW